MRERAGNRDPRGLVAVDATNDEDARSMRVAGSDRDDRPPTLRAAELQFLEGDDASGVRGFRGPQQRICRTLPAAKGENDEHAEEQLSHHLRIRLAAVSRAGD
jgi:hypothetical protein